MNDAGLIVLTSLVSPYEKDRQNARQIIGENDFIEVYVNTSLDTCEKRDVKGLYKRQEIMKYQTLQEFPATMNHLLIRILWSTQKEGQWRKP